VAALIAARDEGRTIADTVRGVRSIPGIRTVVVVADGCSDATAERARAEGARVLAAGRRVGKGGAVEAGLRLLDAEIVLLVDGDVGTSAPAAGILLAPILAGEADLAIGDLPDLAGGGFGVVRRLAGGAIRRLCGYSPVAPLSGQRAATRAVLEACRPFAAGYGLETAMTIDAVRLGFRVVEVPVEMRHRPTGRSASGFAHRAGQGWDILRALAPRALGVR
jgi:glycosyltransferase involved in cell wall biosynthesis